MIYNNYYNYRIGLLVNKEGKIDILTAYDLFCFNVPPRKETFKPISLNENILFAYGFKKSKSIAFGDYYYKKYGILLRKHLNGYYYCSNIPGNQLFNYLHEIQDFIIIYYQCKNVEVTDLMSFVANYGSHYLRDCDK